MEKTLKIMSVTFMVQVQFLVKNVYLKNLKLVSKLFKLLNDKNSY